MPDIRWKAYGISGAVFALDRLTKWIIESKVSLVDTYRVIPGFFDIIHSENRGVVFGIFNDSTSQWRTLILAALSLATVAIMGGFLWKMYRRLDRISLYGFALIMGGAAGNVFDRLVSGRVTDFLLFYIGQYQWPAFNVADSAITIGACLVMLMVLFPGRQAANVP